MSKHLPTTLAACAALCMTAVACANEAPEVEATFGETEGVPGGDTDGGTEGDTDSPEDYCVQGDGSLDPAISNPVRYQCNGNGGGVLRWEQCGSSDPISLSCGINDQSNVNVVFPPGQDGDPTLNAQICCQPDLFSVVDGDNIADQACIDDCARSACSEAIQMIQDQLDGLATGVGCNQGCVDRSRAGLETWRDFLSENYGDCLNAARFPGLEMTLPNADIDLQVGAVYNGFLDLDCTVAADAVETQISCAENFNPEEEPPESGAWRCDISGLTTLESSASPPQTSSSLVRGTVTYSRGECPGGGSSCWFQVDELALSSLPASTFLGELRSGSFELAYPMFGSYDTATDDGTSAEKMMGLDVSMEAKPSASPDYADYDFRLKNTQSADIEVGTGFIEFDDVVFEWATGHKIILDATSTGCVKL